MLYLNDSILRIVLCRNTPVECPGFDTSRKEAVNYMRRLMIGKVGTYSKFVVKPKK